MSLLYREHYSRKGSELKMDMKVHLPVATLPLDNGCEYYYFNSKFLPIFYRIPKEILEIRGKELMWIPRTPASAYYDAEVIRFIESDIFLKGVIDCVAYMVWPYLNVSPKMEVYSNHDPAWIVAYSLAIWVKGFIDYDGMWDGRELKSQIDSFLHFRYPYIPMEESQKRLSYIVPQVMKQYNIDKVIEVIKENRCFEDFVDNWESNQKIDFTRKWYHTRTKHPTVSLDAEIEQYAKCNDGRELDFEDVSANAEEQVISEVIVKQFMESLSEKDRKILEMRLEGYTQEEIAEQLGYKNHSGVQKRITKIGLAYQEFTKVDLGFDEEN